MHLERRVRRCRDGAAPRICQAHGRRPEGLEVDVASHHTPGGECGNQGLHQGRRPAHIKRVPAMRQHTPQQIHIDMPAVVEVPAWHIVRTGAAVDHVQMKAGMRSRERLQLLLESLLTPMAHAIEEMDRAPWLLRKAPAQHAHHGRDANASADQHGGQTGIHVDMEMAGGRLHPQHVAFTDAVVQMVRSQPGRQPGLSGRGRGALDGDPVARLSRPVRQRVAARESPPRALRGHLAVGKLQLKGQELPRFERRQGAAGDGFEIKGTLRLCAVFKGSAHHAKLAPAGPGAR